MSEDTLTVQGKEWFDRINGNSYCSVRVYWEGEEVARVPFQYGYGDFYLQVARDALEGWFPPDTVTRHDNGMGLPLWRVAENVGFRLDSHIARGRSKREVKEWGADNGN